MSVLYAIVDWEDHTSSVISLSAITSPRIEFDQYRPGQEVTAKFHTAVYKCTIVKIGGSKNLMEKTLDRLLESRNDESVESITVDSNPRTAGPAISQNHQSETPVAASKKRRAPKRTKEQIEQQKQQEQRKRAKVLSEIQNFENVERPAERPSTGMKSPKSVFVHAACVKCASLQQKLDSMRDQLDERDDTIEKLQGELRSMRASLQHANEKLKRSETTTPVTCTQSASPRVQMVELVPGSGVQVTEAAIKEVATRQTSTAKARFLLNCVLTSDEIIDRGSVAAVGKTVINAVALYASDPAVSVTLHGARQPYAAK